MIICVYMCICICLRIYIYIYRYMYIYIYIYTHMRVHVYIHTLSLSRKPSGHFCMVSVVDIIQRCFMVSVVVVLRFPSLVVFMVYVVAGKHLYGIRRRMFDGFCRRRRIHNC